MIVIEIIITFALSINFLKNKNMKKVLISLLLLFILAPSFSSDVLAQSKHKNQTPPSASQGTFRVYAVLKIISKGRIALDFGQKAEGGYFHGQINDILLDSEGKDYQIKSDHDYLRLLNNLSRLGWHPTNFNIEPSHEIWESHVVMYKDVRNESEIIEGIKFKNP